MKEIIYSGASPMLMPGGGPGRDIIFDIILLLFLLLCFVALMTFLAALFREMNEGSKNAIHQAPLRTVLLGLVGYAVFGGLAAWLYSEAFIFRLLETEIAPGFLAFAILVTALPLLLSLLGAPGTFSYVGDRIAVLRGGEMNGLTRTVMGLLVSLFAALFPVIGWFLVTPWLLATSFGAGATGIFRRR